MMVKKATSSKRPAKKAAPSTPRKSGSRTPLRFAHPFFTTTAPANRAVSAVTGTTSMSQFAAEKLGPIPASRGDAVIDLKDVIGAPGVNDIKNAGAIKFHFIGDSGRDGGNNLPQEQVADAMTTDYDPAAHGHSPALLVHIGDVIYGHRKSALYRDEFYRPYMKYPGKIMAIAGNHDGEMFKETDPVSLREFLNNFCATTAVLPDAAGGVRIFRETMTQPGVYWMLSAPFINIIGLYSNIAEGPGNLLGKGQDERQMKWLTKTLKALKQSADNRALVVATHHPPFSSGGHSSSREMLAQLDQACADAGVAPHAMLAGHSHNYQRYTRTARIGGSSSVQIPYLVAGCGGHAASAVTAAHGQQMGDTVFEKSMQGFGYLLLTATATKVSIEMVRTTDGVKQPFDKVTIDIASHVVS